jgi:light-regulated signal transduction histidine kinase (bacteriophytochrome)
LAFQIEEKAKRAAELTIAYKELESFNYISSHDLQEPLRKIQVFTSRILDIEFQKLTDKGIKYLHQIQTTALHMRTLIIDLLVYSRTTTSEQKFEHTDLNKLIENVVAEFKETIDNKKAIIEISHLCNTNVIPIQFHQLIHNLLDNALKFSKPGIPPHITIKNSNLKFNEISNVKLEAENDYCHICIADNGIGFEQQYHEHIFDIFKRLHDKQKYPGTGIGLALVKKIVDNHKGVITATGEPDKGATFDIYIPLSGS